jgi:flagellin-like hook-associated protein FlgL
MTDIDNVTMSFFRGVCMVIQHNFASMNAARMLTITSSKQKKSAEKLSSGYRINRAADDAAGLSISEKMRKQIRGLDRASTNSDDGISMAQTAEGALAEVHDMLHRMTELAVQAANETESVSDREAIQAEVNQILTEIDRVSESTKFNETYLLKGGSGSRIDYLNLHDAGLGGIVSNCTDGPSRGAVTIKRLNTGSECMIAGRIYTIGTGKADVQNIINTTGEAGDTVVINDTNVYHIIDLATGSSGNEAEARQSSWIADRIGASTRKVTVGGGTEVYSLIDSYGTATLRNDVASKVTSSTDSVTISGDNNGHSGTYTLLSGGYRAELRNNIASAINSNTYNVTIGGTTYKLKNANGYVATLKSDIANLAASAATVTYNGRTYTLRSGGAAAETKSNVINTLGNEALPASVAVKDKNTGVTTNYQVISDSETVDVAAVPAQINLSDMGTLINGLDYDSTVRIGANTYLLEERSIADVQSALGSVADDTEVLINGSGKYLAESQVKTIAQLRSDINSSGNGTGVSITGASGTSQYTVRDYNAATVRSYIQSAGVGEGSQATTSVTIGGSTYALRSYNLDTVKTRISSYGDSEYDENTTTGTLINVDGAEYTAESTYYRQAICIAYGEDQQTNVTARGAGDDDVIRGGDKVTYKGVDYYTMQDNDADGYDDKDSLIVTEGRAYKIIAKELEKASSIGATESRAVAYDKDGNDIVDSVTMAADFLLDPNNESSLVRFTLDRASVKIEKDLRIDIHAGSDADMTNKIGVDIRAMSAAGLGIKNLNVVDDSGINATYALDAIEDALGVVSAQRSLLGAVQNRMEHTIRNLDNVVENTTSAESRLRDTDMADEMVEYRKNNILIQAGQAMMAQANQTPNAVLNLLG